MKDYQIIEKIEISENIFKFKIFAPLIASSAKAGQFVVVMVDEKSERIPLTIADWDEEHILLFVQTIGHSTQKINSLEVDDCFYVVSGPLGKSSEIMENKKIVMVGGGVGIAAIYPIAKMLKKMNNYVCCIIGAKNKDLLILKEELYSICDKLLICTDDGSDGFKGFVTEKYKEEINKVEYDASWAVGPTIMMKYLSKIASENNLTIWTSLNPVMIDGTGMCGGCRVEVDGLIKYACVDGPEFDGRKVNWDNLLNRQKFN